MKSFIRSILQFSLFLIIFYIVSMLLWDTIVPIGLKQNINYRIGSYGHMFSRIKEVKKTKDVDILILGSSHAYRGFDPRIFRDEISDNTKVFNLGSSSQTPIQTEVLLDRYLETLNPQTIIYEVFPFGFSSDGVESSMDIIANDKNDKGSLEMALKINHIKTWNTLIVGYIRDLFGMNTTFVEPKMRGEDTYVSGGYVEKKIKFYKKDALPEETWVPKQEQMLAFERCLKKIRERGIRLVFVYAPVTGSLYKAYTNMKEFDKIMSKQGAYHNFNYLLDLDDSLHFYDSNHLNQNGVEIFNKKLIDIVFKKSNRP